MSVKAPAEKKFRRAHVKPARRKDWRASFGWRAARFVISGAIVLYAAYLACDLVVGASALQVRHINVFGNVRLSAGEVQALMEDLRGRSILTADLPAHRRRLLASPWVADVGLRRVLPSTVEVFVSERRPVGLCRFSQRLYLVDRTGALIDEYGPRYAEFDLPIIDGLVRQPASGEPAVDPARAELAARVIDSVMQRDAIGRRVSQIDVSNKHNVAVLLDGDSALLQLGEDDFLRRLEDYLDVAPVLRGHLPDIDYVDLRFGQQYFVKPRTAPRPAVAAPVPERTGPGTR